MKHELKYNVKKFLFFKKRVVESFPNIIDAFQRYQEIKEEYEVVPMYYYNDEWRDLYIAYMDFMDHAPYKATCVSKHNGLILYELYIDENNNGTKIRLHLEGKFHLFDLMRNDKDFDKSYSRMKFAIPDLENLTSNKDILSFLEEYCVTDSTEFYIDF